MNRYDIGRGNGLAKLDETLALPNPNTGKPLNLIRCVDEVARMAVETEGLVCCEMQNVTPSVVESIRLLSMAVASLVTIVRARVVTEPLVEEATP